MTRAQCLPRGRLTCSNEHKELGLFGYGEIADLPMPGPYKTTINRWHQLIGAG